MLSNVSRFLTYLLAALYAVLGALLFFMPEQLAPVFAWKVTPFMTMTIGGWCLGNAWLAFISARRWRWKLIHTALIYLWAFGVSELAVLFAFRDKLVLQHPIAWLYALALFVNTACALIGVVGWLRSRSQPGEDVFETPAKPFHRAMAAGFVIIVGFLALYGLFAQIGDLGTNGGIFPEVMSLFTLRSFAVFYLSLTLGALPLLRERNLQVLLNHAFASYGLVVFISAAIVAYFSLFDFAERPGQLIYVGAYLLVGISALTVLLREGTGARNA